MTLVCRPKALATVLLTTALLALTGCTCQNTPSSRKAAPLSPATVEQEAPSVRQKTTRGDLALRNLDSQIAARQQAVSDHPGNLKERLHLADLLLTRVQFTGSFDDFDALKALADRAPEDFAGQASTFTLRARYLAAVHRFDEALIELSRAKALGGADIAALEASVQIARGLHLDDALRVSRTLAEQNASFPNVTRWAAAEAALGQFESADARYQAALDAYRDVSPFPVAFAMFQRGVMWAEMADQPERARPLYAEAVRRLRQYVVATVHLAELEADAGHVALAIQRLDWIATRTGDPEPYGVLGALLSRRSETRTTGEGWIARAQQRYDELLDAHRTAFLDHGAEFFAGPGGNPQRALKLARENLQLRNTGRAHDVAVRAAMATGEASLLCAQLAYASNAASSSKNLQALIATQSPRCVR